MEYINKLSLQIDQKELLNDVEYILGLTPLWPNQQISLTSIDGNDDWECSIGKIADLQHKESDFTVINNSIKDLKPSEGVIYIGNPQILKKVCPGVFGVIRPSGYCMIGQK